MTKGYSYDESAIACEDVDGEVIAIDFGSGAYYSMRDTAAAIWRLLLAGSTAEAVRQAAMSSADDATQADAEVVVFLDELVSLGLLTETEETSDSGAFLDSYAPPVIEKFEDMSELIKMDPIHDVSPGGWPHSPS
jgi:Coenzyme PQQ synthesis protein D (PqqD)